MDSSHSILPKYETIIHEQPIEKGFGNSSSRFPQNIETVVWITERSKWIVVTWTWILHCSCHFREAFSCSIKKRIRKWVCLTGERKYTLTNRGADLQVKLMAKLQTGQQNLVLHNIT